MRSVVSSTVTFHVTKAKKTNHLHHTFLDINRADLLGATTTAGLHVNAATTGKGIRFKYNFFSRVIV